MGTRPGIREAHAWVETAARLFSARFGNARGVVTLLVAHAILTNSENHANFQHLRQLSVALQLITGQESTATVDLDVLCWLVYIFTSFVWT